MSAILRVRIVGVSGYLDTSTDLNHDFSASFFIKSQTLRPSAAPYFPLPPPSYAHTSTRVPPRDDEGSGNSPANFDLDDEHLPVPLAPRELLPVRDPNAHKAPPLAEKVDLPQRELRPRERLHPPRGRTP